MLAVAQEYYAETLKGIYAVCPETKNFIDLKKRSPNALMQVSNSFR